MAWGAEWNSSCPEVRGLDFWTPKGGVGAQGEAAKVGSRPTASTPEAALTRGTLCPPPPQAAWPVLGRVHLLPKEAVCLHAHGTHCTTTPGSANRLPAADSRGGPGKGSS